MLASRTLDAFRANFLTTSAIAGRTPPLHSPGCVNHLPDGKSLFPIMFRLSNHSSLKFLGVIFRRTPNPRTVLHAVSLPIFSRHMLYGGQALHGYIIFPSPSQTLVPSIFLSNNARSLQYVHCILRSTWECAILRSQNCYELLPACTVF